MVVSTVCGKFAVFQIRGSAFRVVLGSPITEERIAKRERKAETDNSFPEEHNTFPNSYDRLLKENNCLTKDTELFIKTEELFITRLKQFHEMDE